MRYNNGCVNNTMLWWKSHFSFWICNSVALLYVFSFWVSSYLITSSKENVNFVVVGKKKKNCFEQNIDSTSANESGITHRTGNESVWAKAYNGFPFCSLLKLGTRELFQVEKSKISGIKFRV